MRRFSFESVCYATILLTLCISCVLIRVIGGAFERQQDDNKNRVPRVVFGGTQHLDAGIVVLDRQKKNDDQVTIVVENHTDRPLHIDRIDKSCSCLGVQLTQNPIPPKGESILKLRIAKGQPFGRRSFGIDFHSKTHNDWKLLVEGLFLQSFHLTPSQFRFGAVPAGEQRTAQLLVWLIRHSPKQDELTVAMVPDQSVKIVSLERTSTRQFSPDLFVDQYQLTVRVRADRAADASSAQKLVKIILSRTRDASVQATVWASWSIQPAVVVYPTAIGFRGEPPQQRMIFVATTDKTALRILDMACDLDFIDLRAESMKSPARWCIVTSFSRKAHEVSNVQKGTVRIFLDHPKTKVLQVPISCAP